jgi:pyruvate kinase
MNPERVPVVQKMIISRAREFRRPVITATQMLESMTENPRPTRAEASDVANAIFDGSDAVMLSAETASGKYPVETVSMMARIIEEAEGSIREFPRPSSALSPAGAHRGLFAGGGNAPPHGADLGRHAARYFGRAQNRRPCRHR